MCPKCQIEIELYEQWQDAAGTWEPATAPGNFCIVRCNECGMLSVIDGTEVREVEESDIYRLSPTERAVIAGWLMTPSA